MKSKIIIMNGQGTSGKQSLVDFIKEFDKSSCGTDRILYTSIIDRVKAIALKCGWTGAKDLNDRKFLNELKTLLENYNDLPYSTITQIIRWNENSCDSNGIPFHSYIFIDMREAKDIDRLKKDFPNCTTVLVTRGESKKFNNPADDDVFNYNYDYVIENNGTLEDLRAAAETFWNEILAENSLSFWKPVTIQGRFEWEDLK